MSATDPVQAVAEAIRAHDPDRMACLDHEKACCPCGEAHNMTYPQAAEHQARAAIVAARPDRVAQASGVDVPEQGAMMRESKLLVMLGFEKSMDNRHPITTALFIEDDEGNRIVTVSLDEHQMVGLLSGSVIRVEGRVAE